MLAIMDGKRPRRPANLIFGDRLWALAQRCWSQDPRLRPDILEVLQVLRRRLVAPPVRRLGTR